MDYDVLLSTVLDSDAADWVRVERAPSTWNGFDRLHVFKPHTSVSLAWGAEYNNGRGWEQEWSQTLPDKQVFGYWAEIRWNGAAIHSELLLSVDGGRGWLPVGKIPEWGPGTQVTAQEMAFARLVDRIARGEQSQFEDYMRIANITVSNP